MLVVTVTLFDEFLLLTGNHGEEEDSACHWPLAETSFFHKLLRVPGIFEVASCQAHPHDFPFMIKFASEFPQCIPDCFNLCMFYDGFSMEAESC